MEIAPLPEGQPPSWLGELVFARSSFNPSNPRPKRWGMRIFLGALFGLGLGLLTMVVVHTLLKKSMGRDYSVTYLQIKPFVFAGGAIFGALLVQLLIKAKSLSAMVGTAGVAIVRRKGKKDMVLGVAFDKVAGLDTQDVNYVGNLSGAYKGSTRNVRFLDEKDRTIFSLHGMMDAERPDWDRAVDPVDPTTIENSAGFVNSAIKAFHKFRAEA